MLGIARYEANRLDWFQVLTLSPRPTRSLARERLVILDWHRPDEGHAYAILPGWVDRELRLRDVDARAGHERGRLLRPGRLARVRAAGPHRSDRLTSAPLRDHANVLIK